MLLDPHNLSPSEAKISLLVDVTLTVEVASKDYVSTVLQLPTEVTHWTNSKNGEYKSYTHLNI